jgi:hypothetical protein
MSFSCSWEIIKEGWLPSDVDADPEIAVCHGGGSIWRSQSKRNKYIFSFNKKPLHLQDKLNEQEILVNILSVLISMVVV